MVKYKPATKQELELLVQDESIYLGSIDTSLITDMSELFSFSLRQDFSGIETWDVSKVTDMSYMFTDAFFFNSDISNWDVRSVTDMTMMFDGSQVCDNIPGWYNP